MWGKGGAASLAECSGLARHDGGGGYEPEFMGAATLSCIADELAASDPKLASTLAVFNRLTWGEEMPASTSRRGPAGAWSLAPTSTSASRRTPSDSGRTGARPLILSRRESWRTWSAMPSGT